MSHIRPLKLIYLNRNQAIFRIKQYSESKKILSAHGQTGGAGARPDSPRTLFKHVPMQRPLHPTERCSRCPASCWPCMLSYATASGQADTPLSSSDTPLSSSDTPLSSSHANVSYSVWSNGCLPKLRMVGACTGGKPTFIIVHQN